MASRWNSRRWALAWSIATALLILGVGAVNLTQAVRRIPPAPRYPPRVPTDVAMRHEQRFAAVRAALQARRVRGPIGYVSDLPPDKMADDPAAMQELFVTQFVLVPVILDTGTADCEWAITNLHRAPLADRMPAGFRLIEDLGGGVTLLRKEAP